MVKRVNSLALAKRCDALTEDAIANTVTKKNWRGIFISLLIIVVMSGVIAAVTYLIFPFEHEHPFKLSVHAVEVAHWSAPDDLVFCWLPTELPLHSNSNSNSSSFHVEAFAYINATQTQTIHVMHPLNGTIQALSVRFTTSFVRAMLPSPTGKQLLIITEEPYPYLVNVDVHGVDCPQPLRAVRSRFVTWSSTGSYISFTKKSSLYMFNATVGADLVNQAAVLVSDDVDEDTMFAGGTQASLFGPVEVQEALAQWWSPDDAYLVYQVSDYGDLLPKSCVDEQHLSLASSASLTAPAVKLFLFHLATRRNVRVALPCQVFADLAMHADNRTCFTYLAGVSWWNSTAFAVSVVDASYAAFSLLICSAANAQCTPLHRMDVHGMVKPVGVFPAPELNLIFLLKTATSGLLKGRQLVRLSIFGGYSFVPARMEAPAVIQRILAVDSAQDAIFVEAHYDKHRSLQVLRIDLNNGSVDCVTCSLDKCTPQSTSPSSMGVSFLVNCGAFASHRYRVVSSVTGVTNVTALPCSQQDTLKYRSLKQYVAFEYLTLPETETEAETEASSLVQLSLSTDHHHEYVSYYPLIVEFVQEFPESATASRMHPDWCSYLVMTRRVVCSKIDSQGSENFGTESDLFGKIGQADVDARAKTIKKLQQLRYVDANRTILYGENYGALVAAKTALKVDARCLILVNPLTSFHAEDVANSAKYLGLPSIEHANSYRNANLSNFASGFNKTRMLLILAVEGAKKSLQGLEFVKVLTDAGNVVQTHIYPGSSFAQVRRHAVKRENFFRTVLEFIEQCKIKGGY